jgi:CheY-like chemotaxis protein
MMPRLRGGRAKYLWSMRVDVAESHVQVTRTRGHSVRTRNDGFSALDARQKWLPEIVILDGYEAARRIAVQWPERERPVLAALTGWGEPEDKQQATAAGFDVHFI